MHLRNWLSRPASYAPLKTSCKPCFLFLLAPAILLAAFWATPLRAAQVTLAWDPNKPAPEEYRLYQGIGTDHFNATPVWRGTRTTCTVNDLRPDTQYHFVVRAYADGIESGDSNKVTYRTPPTATPPDDGPTDNDNVTVPAVAPPAEPPNAQAGNNQTVASGSRVQLNGSASVHPLGLPLAYQWIQTAGPTVVLTDAETAWPSFTAPTVAAAGSIALVFEMTVTDARQLACSDTCLVVVKGTTPPAEVPETGTDGDNGPAADENPLLGPTQPIVYYPAENADSVPLTPWLAASEFSDPECAARHVHTQWHIVQAGSNQLVAMDAMRTHRPLTRLWVPFFALAPDTSYICRVRYYDDRGQVSEWSAPVRFSTRGSWFGRSDAVMAYNDPPPPDTDLNGNGIPDQEERERIQAVQTADGRHSMAVSIHNSAQVRAISRIAAIDPQTVDALPADAASLPYGLLAYRLELDRPERQVQVTIHLSDPVAPHGPWLVYGADGQWTAADPETLQVSKDGLTVLRTITDGGTDDVDGAANGVVIDHLGPLQTAGTTATPGKSLAGDGGSDVVVKGCLIDMLWP